MDFSRMPEDYQLFLATVTQMKQEFRRSVHGAYWMTFALMVAAMIFKLWPVLVEIVVGFPQLSPMLVLCLMSLGFLAHSAKPVIATDLADNLYLKFRRDQFDRFLAQRTFGR